MGINVLAGQQGITENAVALTQGVIASESAQVKGKETESKRDSRESIISDLAKGNNGKTGLRVLRGLVQSPSRAVTATRSSLKPATGMKSGIRSRGTSR